MAVEAIEKVTQTELEARKRKDAAVADNKQRILAAQKEAQRLLEQSRADAEAKVRDMMSQAEAEAGKVGQKVMDQASKESDAMKGRARKRLDQAAQMIVERVVNR